ncbi:MAG: SBBP repeat-containing protein, partial [Deltaproteobacteria bacterium]|nr:SBBP repeat-containing protein [Deltaproteobacteria bacterium]
NSSGSGVWTRTFGGTHQDFGWSIAVDDSDNVYITGSFRGTADFDPDSVATDNQTSAGLEDIFLTKINSGGSYGWTKTLGGTDEDFSRSMAVDGSDNVYITGSFRGTVDFDPGAGTDNQTSAGEEDIFITKINFDGSYDLTKTIGGTDQDFGQTLAVDDDVNVYITGSFRETVDFDPGAGTDNQTSAGEEDIFLTKFRMVGFVITPTSVTTTGTGDTATFTVRLLSEPSASVTLPVSSSNLSVGTVDTSSLIFTTINWSVDQTVTVTSLVGSSQTFSIILGAASSGDADYNGLNPTDVRVDNIGSDSGGSGSCFIATAAYGSPLASQIKVLSRFRDHFLLTNEIGLCFVRFYNTYSPPMADFIKKHDRLRVMVRLSLIPLVGASWLVLKIGPVSTVVFMLLFGIGLIGFVKRICSKKKFSR